MTIDYEPDELDIQMVFDNIDENYSEADAKLIKDRYKYRFTVLHGSVYYDWFQCKDDERKGDSIRISRNIIGLTAGSI